MEKHRVLAKMFEVVPQIKKMGKSMNPIPSETNFKKYGIPPSGHELLRILNRRGNSNQRGLAKTMRISSQAVSELIKKLEINGYVQKIPGTQNNENIIALTDKGMEIGAMYHKRIKDDAEKAFSNFTEEEILTFYQLLEKLNVE